MIKNQPFMGFQEEWQNRKYQESVSPPRQQLPQQNLSGVTVLKFWSLKFKSIESLQYPGEDMDSKLWLISVYFSSWYSSSYPSPTPSYIAGSHAHVPRAACTQLVGTRVGKMDPLLQILGDLCSDCCLLLLIIQMQTERWQLFLLHFLPFLPSSLPLAEVIFPGDLKAHCPPPISFFSFSLFGSQTLKTRTSKTITCMGKIRK